MLRELLAKFSIDTGQAVGALKNIDSSLNGAASRLGGFVEGLGGSLGLDAITSFVEGQIAAGSAINDLSERLGVGTDELQQFQFAAGLVGVDAERAGTSLQFLNKNIGEALGGNAESVKSFKELDVAIKNSDGTVRELGDVIPEVADAFAKMGSDQERTEKAMKLFGKSGAALIPLLKGGSENLTAMRKEFEELGGGMSKDFIQQADATGDEIDKLKFGLVGVKSAIAGQLLPYVQKAIAFGISWEKRLIKLTRETNLTKYAAMALGALASLAAGKAAAGWAKMFGILPKGNAGFVTMLRSLGGFGAIIAVVGGLFLVLEDLFTAVNDGDSYIVELVEHYLGLNEANGLVSELKAAWQAVQAAMVPLEPLLDSIGNYIAKIASEYGPAVLHVFVEIVKTVAQAITKVADFFGLLNTESTGDARGDVLKRRAEGLAARTAPIVSPESLPKVTPGGTLVTNTTTNAQKISVTVQGGPTPQATGAAVKDGVVSALDNRALSIAHHEIPPS